MSASSDAVMDNHLVACGGTNCGDAGGNLLWRAKLARRPLGIFKVASHRSGREQAIHEYAGLEAVARLDVGGNWDRHHGGHPGDGGERLLCRHPLAVAGTERAAHRRT